MAKLWPLFSHCKYFMKFVFVLSFIKLYTEDFNIYQYVCWVFANQVTNYNCLYHTVPYMIELAKIDHMSTNYTELYFARIFRSECSIPFL